MYLTSNIKNALALTTVLVFFSACGGGGGGGSSYASTPSAETTPNPVIETSDPVIEELTGQFIDGPVAGVTYICSSGMSGVTNNHGEFTCQEGNTVTFKIGNVMLGSALAESVITPATLYPNNPQAAVNVARLLQSLDVDEELSTIEIDSGEIAALDASLDVTANTFEEKATNMLKKTLVASDAAMAHMNKNLVALAKKPVTLSSEQKPYIPYEPNESMRLVDAVPSSPAPAPAAPTSGQTIADLILSGPAVITQPTVPASSPSTPQSSSPAASVPKATAPIVETPLPAPSEPAEENAPNPVQICQNGPATHEGHVTDSATGKDLAGVEVSVGGCSTTTDAQGFYELPNIATNDRAVINFNKNDYYQNSAIIQIRQYSAGTKELSTNFLEYALDAYDHDWNLDSQTRAAGTHIDIPAAIYTDRSGKIYEGKVRAGLAYEDIFTDKGKRVFPGAYEGKSSDDIIVPFVSYGLLVIDMKDTNGNALSISENATVTFTSTSRATAEHIPLWSYDYTQGIWIEEGYATRQSDGSYKGNIAHLGTWSLSKPIENAPGIYRARIVYEDGTPAKDIRVHSIGANWIKTDLSTDANGIFEVEVIPGSSFQLTAFNYKYKYEAIHQGAIQAIASGKVVEDRM